MKSTLLNKKSKVLKLMSVLFAMTLVLGLASPIKAATTYDITVTAVDAVKPYDGSPFSCNKFFVTGDLQEGDVVYATVTGEITDVGSTNNKVSAPSVYVMRDGEIVTGDYNITLQDGTLEVTKRKVTLTSASYEKEYDGTALTNHNVNVSGSGFVDGQGATYTVTGSQMEIGESPNTFDYELNEGTKANNYDITTVYGTLEVTKNTKTITIYGADESKTYDGTELKNNQFTYTNGIIAPCDILEAIVVGSITDAGKADNVVQSYKVRRIGTTTDVTSNYTFAESVPGELEVKKKDLTITSESAEKVYDGTPLTWNYFYSKGFVVGQGLSDLTCTGSQLVVGTSKNTFTYELSSNAKKENYNIKEVEGDLTVTPILTPITITADSAAKVYDGTDLTAPGYTYTDGILIDGDVLTATVEGSIMVAGTAANKVTSYKVMRGDIDVTNCYTFAEPVDGELVVTPIATPITIKANTASKAYDGKELIDHGYTYTEGVLVEGDMLLAMVVGHIKDVGTTSNKVMAYKVMRGDVDVTSCYTFADSIDGTLTVTAASTAVKTGDTNNMAIFFIIAGVALAAGTSLIIFRKREKF